MPPGFSTMHLAYFSLTLVCLLTLLGLLLPLSFDSVVVMIEIQYASVIFGLFTDQLEKLSLMTLLRIHFSRV